jgi:NAD(P)-dependent dehydrogenase (short-subunit alcohol dehydrogenase family)
MAQTAAYELTGQNVRVNAICPGLIQASYRSLCRNVGQADQVDRHDKDHV